jgi:hypothetical protein
MTWVRTSRSGSHSPSGLDRVGNELSSPLVLILNLAQEALARSSSVGIIDAAAGKNDAWPQNTVK